MSASELRRRYGLLVRKDDIVCLADCCSALLGEGVAASWGPLLGRTAVAEGAAGDSPKRPTIQLWAVHGPNVNVTDAVSFSENSN
uniref:Uncharacterized protein n=1 Tax=Chromera velia CCMP2878 TaxID=1169474 RepID=A0A0G4GTT4_9ALVE|eukprot:Cvel_23357.t1-p1 / transcript=Cvel_23357.t1 / gene=Cvel_23357 / organism=Chromera_velia_CCMP2878 / gene_product=hypothetical protein / transcript_product=hypothetical protein / location=Cvel_scaffold2397:16756-19703(+) / protein_length=84 / sequence_SO=supercontig / SO=protein_coding / is_pseudo=false